MMGSAITIVSDFGDLQAAAPAWWDLWHRSPGATPFQSPAWLVPWWRHFHPGQLFAIAAWESGQLVGLAPLYREEGPLGRRLLPIGISLTDYHDILLDPTEGHRIGATIVQETLRRRDAWDLWSWEELPPDALALSVPFPSGCDVETEAQSACPVLPLLGTTLAECLPSRKRRDIALARNRSDRRGGCRIERVGEADLEVALAHLFRLHARRWESRGESGVLADQRVQAFHMETSAGLLAAGLLRMFILHIADRVAAVFYGFQHRERIYGYLTGLEPDFEYESPGVTIIAHAIEQALDERVREFHFLRGQELYKYRWGAVDRWNRRLSVRRNEAHDAAA